MEELAKTGAGTKYQIFGQLGLDHGPEWMHAKITNINPEFVKPKSGVKIYTGVEPIATAEVFPVPSKVTLGTPVFNTATDALVIEYIGTPLDTPALAYAWEIGNNSIGSFTPINSATGPTYTPIADDVGKFIRCKVTASGAAVGVIYSNAKKVQPIKISVTSEIAAATPTVIDVVLDTAVTGLLKTNFVVEKDGIAYEDFMVTETSTTLYAITMQDAATEGEVFTVTITKAGYEFTGTAVTNNVTD
jgi:hypothetical protein